MKDKKTTARGGLPAFIPQKVSGRVVLGFFESMRWMQRLRGRKFDNLYANAAAFSEHRPAIAVTDGYIEDQHSYGDMMYGRATVRDSGCEPIAVYNALRSMGEIRAADLPRLLARFERDGIAQNGKFGTSPCAAVDFFTAHGYHAEMETESTRFDTMMRRADCGILTYFNNVKNVADGAHTVCLTKDSAGWLTLHNAHGGMVGPYPTVEELLLIAGGGHAKPIALAGIWKKERMRKEVAAANH